MGQGYSLTTLSAGSAGIDAPELSDLAYEKALGDARFMKAIRAKHRDGVVVAKVVMKPYSSLKFASYIESILRERRILMGIPNALGYHRTFETSSNGYLVRQYVYSSIYDRLSTRPFLEDIEKKWLTFQLLCAVRDCHAKELYHGDIKTENVLVTSWSWLYLTDFSSSFKPTYLPEDNPADFSFFFDISGRRTCYLAPERFLAPGEQGSDQGVTWAMDIFSVGCVIAELFLETPIFSLSQLFKYRTKEYDPVQMHLNRIEDVDIREMVTHMIKLEPESRYSADEYLNFWRQKAFPDYFYSFLHQYMHLITDPSSGLNPISSASANLGEPDERIDRVYHDFDKISYLLGWPNQQDEVEVKSSRTIKGVNQLLPLHLDLPDRPGAISYRKAPSSNDGALIFLTIVTSALRSTARSTARVRACELLLAFSERITDEAKMDRVLPYFMSLLHDSSDICRVAGLRSLTQLLAMIPSTSPANAYIFPEYILPRLESLTLRASNKPSPLVRATYASCLAALAESASKFLDVVQALRDEGALPPADNEMEAQSAYAYRKLYDDARVDLVRFFETETKAFLTDTDANVRRAFLSSVSSLCVFFGTAKANDVILSHLNTYLNDKDWKLKSAFFETIVGVAVYVGGTNLEEFILPLMIQALSDSEECVVEKVLRSLATMASMGLFQRSRLWALIDLLVCFTMHPNTWIREAAAQFVSCATKYLSVADRECIVKPIIKPYLRVIPATFAEIDLLDALKKPLPRKVLDLARAWAGKTDKGTFWKSVQQRLPAFFLEDKMPAIPAEELRPNALSRLSKNEEDSQWVNKLRNAGMSADDDMKFMALSAYIWRATQRSSRETPTVQIIPYDEKIVLSDKKVEVQTVFFEQQVDTMQQPKSAEKDKIVPRLQTIADALNEASKPLEDRDHHRSSSSSLRESELDDAASRNASMRSSVTWAPPTRREHTLHNRVTRGSVDTNDTSSIMSSDEGLTHPKHNHTLSRKGSAMTLMQRNPTKTKAIAEISTSETTAIGEVEVSHKTQAATNPSRINPGPGSGPTGQVRSREAHSYAGRDPDVLKHLDGHHLRAGSPSSIDLGRKVTAFHTRRSPPGTSITPQTNHAHPMGTLVTMFGEHQGPVRRVAVSPDHRFFITGSDDGTVRIWDCSRLERNLAHRAKQVYKHGNNVKITSLCFVENTHCFISTADDGSVHVVRVEVTETSQGSLKYGALRTIRVWQLPDIETHVAWCEHFKSDGQSIIMLATNTSRIYAVDLNTMTIVYALDNPVRHGTPTCFCLDSRRHWLLVGTTTGILDLWDLRFRMRLRSWGFRGASSVKRILLHPVVRTTRANQQTQQEQAPTLLCIAGGTGTSDITIWNLDKATCDLAFHSTPVDVETIPPASSMAQGVPPTRSPPDQSFTLEDMDAMSPAALHKRMSNSTMSATPSPAVDVCALAVGLPLLINDPLDLPNTSEKSDPYLISAGPDRRIRYWNLSSPAKSKVVSGLAADEVQPQFVAIEPTSMDAATFWEERRKWKPVENVDGGAPRTNSSSILPAAPSEGPGSGEQRKANVGSRRSESSGGARQAAAANGEQAKQAKKIVTPAITEHQQQLLKTHLDAILDVAILEWPMRMVVSVDRSGMVYVFA